MITGFTGSSAGITQATWVQQRGDYWIKRLAAEYGLHVQAKPWKFFPATKAQIGGGFGYGLTQSQPPRVLIRDALLNLRVTRGDKIAVPLIDEMLVHELVHATGIWNHGPKFKAAYGKVYPWSKPGPVTDFDPGTPRRVLWTMIRREVP